MWFLEFDKDNGKLLREATTDEINLLQTVINELEEYAENIKRFERVDYNFRQLKILISNCKGKSIFSCESEIGNAVANFLYSFNECLDHWNTYIKRQYGADSDYFKKYKKLTNDAFDNYDSYKITYELRNYQHIGQVVHHVSYDANCKAIIYAHRSIFLQEKNVKSKMKEALKNYNEDIELMPLLEEAKKLLEKINIKLLFFSITPEIEQHAIQAIQLKEKLTKPECILLLGDFKDGNNNIIEPDDEIIKKSLSQNHGCYFQPTKDIPWGICNMLRLWQGTDYKNC